MSVEYQLEREVAVITLDRADRFNAIDASLSEGLVEALGRAGVEARVAILTGAGRAFCSGADLNVLLGDYESEAGPDLARLLDEVFHPAIDALVESRVPVIGALNGVAAGAGLGLALACDLRIMSDAAFLTSAFTAIGLIPDSGTSWWLSRHLGVSMAMELSFTNRRVTAEEAKSLGLCLDVVPGEKLMDRALEVAADLADMVPAALVATRRLVREATGTSLAEAMEKERVEQGRLGRTAEHLEGVMAFIEKRKPDFRG